MTTDKVLSKIQLAINDLAPTLELFVDENIQPSAEDCEKLQEQLCHLQENLAVYKYNKQNKELSPSFNIHAKLSEKEAQVEKLAEVVEEIKLAVKIEEGEKIEIKEVIPEPVKKEIVSEPLNIEVIPEPLKKESGAPKTLLVIGLNDKFRFMNELFSQNSLEYNIALEQLNNLVNWNETEIYLNSLKHVYDWKDTNEAVKHFYSLAKQRFS